MTNRDMSDCEPAGGEMNEERVAACAALMGRAAHLADACGALTAAAECSEGPARTALALSAARCADAVRRVRAMLADEYTTPERMAADDQREHTLRERIRLGHDVAVALYQCPDGEDCIRDYDSPERQAVAAILDGALL